ncbi:endonuclease III domain-containing protein [Moorella sp. Hama-1]|uniref:endonuclease III domain-containing protein n=1 Tax=Moorella sp. Hama-1 TaxID=2138101 RepID=UPI000D64EC7C|nr:endonuclease [Moorella sp. Hama-1]BCV21821.1 endonuclease III [Moorella sp. Hama-1]
MRPEKRTAARGNHPTQSLITGAAARLQEIFERLYRHFGPRHWWPAETPFEVIVGAILTQNVAWKNVEKAIANLNRAGLLTPEAVMQATPEELEPHIRPTGYYRVKARKLKAFSDYLQERYGGSLEVMFAQPLELLRTEILDVFGIGPETADAILCYAGNYPIMVMDAYTRRVFSRLGFLTAKVSYQEMQDFFMTNLPRDNRLYNEYHALIDALANRICLKKEPACDRCPLGAICPRIGVAGTG